MPASYRVLFVCMGNICRSPAAEGVFASKIQDADFARKVVIDSAGTGGWHAGNRADSRMRKTAEKRDYDLTSIVFSVISVRNTRTRRCRTRTTVATQASKRCSISLKMAAMDCLSTSGND